METYVDMACRVYIYALLFNPHSLARHATVCDKSLSSVACHVHSILGHGNNAVHNVCKYAMYAPTCRDKMHSLFRMSPEIRRIHVQVHCSATQRIIELGRSQWKIFNNKEEYLCVQ